MKNQYNIKYASLLDTPEEVCSVHGPVARELHRAGDHVKAVCSTCGHFIKFVPQNEIQEHEIVHSSINLF